MTEEKGQTRPRYEYKVISGTSEKNEGWTGFDEQLNALADEGWEVFQSCAGSEGGFGMGVGSGQWRRRLGPLSCCSIKASQTLNCRRPPKPSHHLR